MNPPGSKAAGAVLLSLGLAGLATGLIPTDFRYLGLIVGALFITFAFGIFGKAGQYARALQPLAGKPVRVEIWGIPLPGSSDAGFTVDSIAPLGFGLWIYLRATPGGPRIKLKIAQPFKLTLKPSHAEISFAGYAQWDSQRVKSPEGRRAPGTVAITQA
jgi:hypothetical protein